MFSSNEFVSSESSEVVAVEVDGGRVHRDELRDVGVAPLAAVDDVGGPVESNFRNLYQSR